MSLLIALISGAATPAKQIDTGRLIRHEQNFLATTKAGKGPFYHAVEMFRF